jgi:hypothetical protein
MEVTGYQQLPFMLVKPNAIAVFAAFHIEFDIWHNPKAGENPAARRAKLQVLGIPDRPRCLINRLFQKLGFFGSEPGEIFVGIDPDPLTFGTPGDGQVFLQGDSL